MNGNALNGRLELIAARSEATGRTALRHQYHSVPFHLSKAYWDGRVLLAQVVNPTAGIFAGDRMESHVSVEEGASLLVTSPSASRAHTMAPDGETAYLYQSFRVAKDGWLEVFPELFIPQRASSYRQRTEIEVAEGGSLYFIETLAPGRVAHGELLAYRHLDWSFSLRVGGRLLAVERALVEPPDRCWMLDVAGWEKAYYASIWMVGGDLANLPEAAIVEIESMTEAGARLTGVSRLSEGVYAVKVLAESSLALRRTLNAVRALLAPWLPNLKSSLRKL